MTLGCLQMVFFQQERTAILSVHPMFLGPNLREHVRMQLAAQVEGTVRSSRRCSCARPARSSRRMRRGRPLHPIPSHTIFARALLTSVRSAARGRRWFYCHGAAACRPRAGHRGQGHLQGPRRRALWVCRSQPFFAPLSALARRRLDAPCTRRPRRSPSPPAPAAPQEQ